MTNLRHDWSTGEITALFQLPFNDLLFQAHSLHREHFDPNQVQISTLLSIKTGACPEDCKYCSQSGHYNTGLEKEKLLEIHKLPVSQQKKVLEDTIMKWKGGFEQIDDILVMGVRF